MKRTHMGNDQNEDLEFLEPSFPREATIILK